MNGPGDKEKHPWSFFGGKKWEKESYDSAMCRLVKQKMGIKIENVKLMWEHYCYAKLSDDNVNNITRSENRFIAFFSFNELSKLFLSTPTQEFISRYNYQVREAGLASL